MPDRLFVLLARGPARFDRLARGLACFDLRDARARGVRHGSAGKLGLRAWLLMIGGLMTAFCTMTASLARAEEPRPALQAPPEETATRMGPPPAALAHYNRGREHYQAGRYRDALVELEVAVKLDPYSPNLVYNVARIYELLGEMDHAIAFYKRYRDLLPPDEKAERERTDLTLQRLQGAREHSVSPQAGRPLQVTKRGVADGPFWGIASVAAGALAGSAATGILALTTEHRAEQFRLGPDGSEKARQHLVDQANRLALASDITLLAGVSLGVTAILMYALRVRTVTLPEQPRARIGFDLQASPTGAMIALRGRL